MTDLVQEISTDYDHDTAPIAPDRDPVPPIEDPLDVLDDEIVECDELNQELDRLINVTMALEDYGVSKSAFAMLKISDLLAGTSLEALGTESFYGSGPEDAESMMAIEALTDKIKEKAAAWSAKVLNFIKTSGEKIMGVLTAVKDKVFAYGKTLTEKSWDAAKATGRTIKAHPFKAIAAAVAAAAVIATIVAMTAAPGTYASVDALNAYMAKIRNMVANIKPPFKKMQVEIMDTEHVHRVHLVYKDSVLVSETVTEFTVTAPKMVELGWTQTAVKTIMSQLNSIWNTTKTGLTSMGGTIIGALKKFDAIGIDMKDLVGAKVQQATKSKLAGWAANKWVERLYMTALWSVVGVVTSLIKDVILKAFRMVMDTFRSLRAEVEPAHA